MTTLVILAAGRGSRVGELSQYLHKSLLPVGGRAVITRQLETASAAGRVVVAVGHRGDQVREYLRLAHPERSITVVDVDLTDVSHVGPGASLLAVAGEVDLTTEDLMIVFCDTMWVDENQLWHRGETWAGAALVPPDTKPERWCRLAVELGLTASSDYVTEVVDKRPGDAAYAWVGLVHVAAHHVAAFIDGVAAELDRPEGELTLCGGLQWLADCNYLRVKYVTWTDVGDEAAYRRQVTSAEYQGALTNLSEGIPLIYTVDRENRRRLAYLASTDEWREVV